MLKARIITALILLFALLAALFLLPESLWLVLCAAVCGAAAWEWGALARFNAGLRTGFALGAGFACLLVGLTAGLGGGELRPLVLAPLYVVSGVFWLALIPFWLRHKWPLTGHGIAIAAGLVVLIPPALGLAHLRHLGPWILLAMMALVWVADIAAYFSGRAFGRRKLAPSISPGKTWEGAFGAAAGVTIFGYAVILGTGALSGGMLLIALPFLFAATAVSIIGDLYESMLKRQAGLKDSGSILPGHGGILDRIDSLTSTLPLAGLLALWLAR